MLLHEPAARCVRRVYTHDKGTHTRRRRTRAIMAEKALEDDLKFMDRNSRMIGAFGLDVIAKMVGMKVRHAA